MSKDLCYTVFSASIYLHRVLAEHRGGASEPTSHSPGGSRGGFGELLISRRCMGLCTREEVVINE